MDIEKFGVEKVKDNIVLLDGVGNFIKDTFSEISDKYSDDSPFKGEVNNIRNVLMNADKSNVFYIIRNSEQSILACLRGLEQEMYLNAEMGEGNSFYSKYIGVKKEYRRLGLGKQLKSRLEIEAIEKMKETQKPSMVISRVNKKNADSIAWNLSNGYKERDEGPKSEYFQYYKDYLPKDFKNK